MNVKKIKRRNNTAGYNQDIAGMKVEDVIRSAYKRAKKSVRISLYAKMEESSGVYSARASLEGNFGYHFWWYIHHLSHKRRAKRYDGSARYGDMVIEAFSAAGYEVTVTEHSILRVEIAMDPLTINIINMAGGAEVYADHIMMTFTVPPEDLVQYLIAFNEYHRRLEDILDELMSESKRIYKTERIMLVTAANLIEGLKIDKCINHALTVDSRGRILCVMHHKDNPSYRKSCRSDLEGLVEAVRRTIPQLTAYRFTGYVEEV